jgi:hypothetical protein
MPMIKRKTPLRPDGVGDIVETVAKVTGIKRVVESVAKATGRDCGCQKRRDALNKRFPFRNTETENESKGAPDA